jgi:TonB family protein
MKLLFVGFVSALLLSSSLTAQQVPKVISNPAPIYPPETAELGYGGTVKLAIRVDKRGKVKVLQSWGPYAPCSNLDDERVKKVREAVIEAASKIEFEPPMKNGEPTEVELSISYSFDPTGAPAKTKDLSSANKRVIDGGVSLGRVKYLARPDYPASARASRLSGAVPISVLTDVDGKVIAAHPLGGHPVLQEPALAAACKSSFEPVQISGVPVQVAGVITFTFAT